MKEPETFEDILSDQLGGFGPFQVLVLVLILIMEIPTTFVAFVPIFHGISPRAWNCNNETMSTADICSCSGNITSIPNAPTSIVTEWDLICDKVWLPDFITSVQMVGAFAGNFMAGSLSDWYGRKYSLISMLALQGFAQILSAAAPNVFVYAFARFVAGAGMSGYIIVSAIYGMEFLTPKWRPLSGSVGPWGEGIMILSLLAYLIRPWRDLTYVLASPFLLIVIIFPFLPESPRWLLGHQKINEAHKVIQYMAKVNGKDAISIELLTQIAAKENPAPTSDEKVARYSYLDLFREKSLRRPTICFMSIWMSWALTYFGISYNIKNMEGDLYLNVLYSGLSDALGYLAPLATFNRIGRRKSLALFLSLTALFLVALAIFYIATSPTMEGHGTITAILLFLGKFSAGGVRASIRCLLGETYPTAVRGMGSALGGVAIGVGAIFAPQLAFAGSYWPSIPYFIFAGTSLVGVGTSFLIPETKDKPLQENLSSRKRSIIDTIISRVGRKSLPQNPESIPADETGPTKC